RSPRPRKRSSHRRPAACSPSRLSTALPCPPAPAPTPSAPPPPSTPTSASPPEAQPQNLTNRSVAVALFATLTLRFVESLGASASAGAGVDDVADAERFLTAVVGLDHKAAVGVDGERPTFDGAAAGQRDANRPTHRRAPSEIAIVQVGSVLV